MMTWYRTTISVLLLLGILMLSSADASAGIVIHVPGDHPTIQAGIDAAANGDMVRVASGTYAGPGNRDLDFSGKNIVLVSEAGASMTTIDCEGAGRGFWFRYGEAAAAVVDGFTIVNGSADQGGGIRVTGYSEPTITNCVIDNCSASMQGGGVFVSAFARPTFTSCAISGNTAPRGGGVRVGDESVSRFVDCTIAGNTASRGGGVAVQDTSSSVFTNCTIKGNQADDGGGIAFSRNCTPTFEQCTITGNLATDGGGLIIRDMSAPIITGCTVAANHALNTGGGIYAISTPAPVVQTIVWSNCADISGDQIYAGPGASISFECGDVDNAGVVGTVLYDANTIFVDPLFCGEYFCTLAPTTAGEYTLDDNSQALAAYSLCGTLIGSQPQGCTGRSFEVAEDALFAKIQDAIDKSVGDVGDSVVVDDGTWTGPRNTELNFHGKNVVLKSHGGGAVIDGGGSVRAIVFENGEDNTSVVEGFILKGGAASLPGSVVLVKGNSSPVMRGCVIKDSGGSAGVVCVESGAPTFESCTVEQNTTSSTHGVLAFVGGNPKLISSFVRNNNAPTAIMATTPVQIVNTEITDNSGGGAYFGLTTASIVQNSDISRNGDRGVVLDQSSATFDGVIFQENAGGGVLVTGMGNGGPFSRSNSVYDPTEAASAPNEFIGCEFSGHSTDRGAGFFFDCTNEPEVTYTVTFTDCRFTGNHATFEGGAVAICGRATNADILPVFIGCTMAANSAQDGGGIYMGVTDVGIGRSALAQFDRSILWGNCSTVRPQGEAFVLGGNEIDIGCSHAGVDEIAGTGVVVSSQVTLGIPTFCDYPGSYYASECQPDATIQGDFSLAPQSPAAPENHPCGPDQIGAFPVVFCVATGVGDAPASLTTTMRQPVPNPFNPITTVEFTLEATSHVAINIYDVQGRLVKTLTDRNMPLGVHKTQWDGRNQGGEPVASGVYFVRFAAGKTVETRKMVLLK